MFAPLEVPPLGLTDAEAEARFDALQQKLVPLWRSIRAMSADEQTIVVAPSLSIDIEAPAGTSVSAIYEGRVVFASWFQGYGKLLIVQHPGNVHSLYGYLSEFNVQVGDRVVRGDPVAWVGDTGSLEGPRLYFEVRYQGKPQDPEQWLRQRG